jgi:HNH endonuclease/AP2 domain
MKSNDPKITIEQARERYHYNPETGKLTFRTAPPNQPKSRIGTEVGYIRETGYGKYRVMKFGNHAIYVHRFVWFWMFGFWPKGLIDHKNGDKLDNRWENLRPASQSQNKSNGERYANNTSGYKGVTQMKNRWRAQITFKQRVYYLGLFDTPEQAHEAYVAKATELQGQFAHEG